MESRVIWAVKMWATAKEFKDDDGHEVRELLTVFVYTDKPMEVAVPIAKAQLGAGWTDICVKGVEMLDGLLVLDR